MMVDFKGRWFDRKVILQCIHWYLAYKLSYRDLEEMIVDLGIRVDYSTVQRWVTRYSPVLEAEFRRGKRPVGGSWRMDESYTKVKEIWNFLYRAVDKNAKTVEFLLSAKRNVHAASRVLRKAMGSSSEPHKLTLDKSGANKAAADKIAAELSGSERHIEIRQMK